MEELIEAKLKENFSQDEIDGFFINFKDNHASY